MPAKPVSDEKLYAAVRAYQEHGSQVAAAYALGIPRCTLQSHLNSARLKGITPETPPVAWEVTDEPLDDLPPIEELLEERDRVWRRKDAAASSRKLIPIKINLDGPIGIALFGDVHIDDNGCNWPLLKQHTELVRNTEGLFAGSVGDLQNAWPTRSRLGQLWASQHINARKAWMLVEWWLEQMAEKLLFIVEGNHDLWAHNVNGLSPIQWVMKSKRGLVEPDSLRMQITLADDSIFTINCRHDFAGHSQWNPAHGIAKAATLGWHDDVLIAGHRHVSAYQVGKDPMTGRVWHAVRAASYKAHDDFAKAKGFPDQNVFECPVVVLNPDVQDQRHRVTVFFNPEQGADYLTWLRAKAG